MRKLFRRVFGMNEYVSEIAEALDTVAAALCQVAAGINTDTPADQRDFAAVLHADARARFADVNRKLDPKQRADLESYIVAICKGKR